MPAALSSSFTARVWVREPRLPPRAHRLDGERILFGRGEHCDVQLSDPTVSWDHLEVTRHGSALMAADLGSRNGTLLNGRAVQGAARLRDGDTLMLGLVQVEVDVAGSRAATTRPSVPPISELTEEERSLARALVARYRDPAALAPRPANRAELAGALFVSERTVQRRLDRLATRLHVGRDAGRDRVLLLAERILELGLDQQR
jgi:predicted component of type VI protein secretion system